MSEKGLFNKYDVEKNGEPVEECFVLEPRSDSAARTVLRTYANIIDNDQLRKDIRNWIEEIESSDAS